MNPEDVEALLEREPRPEPPASVELALRRALERGRRPVTSSFRRIAMVAASLSLFALVLASIFMNPSTPSGPSGQGPADSPAQDKKPAIEVRLGVTNFYKAADGTMWSTGSWEFSCAEGAAKGTAMFALTPEGRGPNRDGKGAITREQAAALMASLKKDGLFTAADAKKCKCDAPVFTVTAREGDAKAAFTLAHDHDDHDGAQRRLIASIIAEVEKHAAPKPAVSIKLEVTNYYTDGAGTMWSSGVWEIDAAEGAENASVRVALEPQKNGKRREQKGTMTRGDLAALVESLKKSGAFEAKDAQPCLCDAPVFVMVMQEAKQQNKFRLAHNHGAKDEGHRAMMEAVIAGAEKRLEK